MVRLNKTFVKIFSIFFIIIMSCSCSVVTELLSFLEKPKNEKNDTKTPENPGNPDTQNPDTPDNPDTKNPDVTTDDSADDFYKVKGEINGTDIKNLRQQIKDGKITKLDLSDAIIVSGGEAYFESDGKSYKTSDNVISDYMFELCENLKSVILPSSVTSIGKRAFCRTGLTKIEFPDNITALGYDSFAYCASLETVIVGKNVTSFAQGVFFSSPVKHAYIKAASPASISSYLFSSTPTIHVYSPALEDYQKTSWSQFGTLTGYLEELYPDDMDSSLTMRSTIQTYFVDNACTKLKPAFAKMSDAELTKTMREGEMKDYIINIALKIKNDDWEDYEKEFRIHEYKAYSDANYWNGKLKASGGSYMANPTGIYTIDENPLYVFVESEIPDDATLYFTGCTANSLIGNAKSGTMLHRGLNVINSVRDALYYVLYTADTQSMTKKLSEWPSVKIHIEGGIVNGYYDVSRHTDSDYEQILNKAGFDLFTVKGEESLFNFKTETYKKYWPSSIENSIRWFDSLTVREKEVMGFCESVASGKRANEPLYLTGGDSIFPVYYNNPNFAIQGKETDAGYANSSNYRTSYNSAGCCSASFDTNRNDFDDWCAAHECGHNNQSAINLEGCGEVSNNLFSNIIRFSNGITTTSGSEVSENFNDYAKHVPFFKRDIWSMTRMYWQLYLYYHLAQKNTSFYPELFKAFREDPMKLWTDSNRSSLKFVRKVCEVAQEDLTDFFTIWGLLEPCEIYVDDYSSGIIRVSQEDVDAAIAEISKYPKKNREILFIEDRVQKVPQTNYLIKTEPGNERKNAGSKGKYGDLGQFSDYLSENFVRSSYTYVQSGISVAMEGSGGVGFLIYDDKSKPVFGSNSRNFTLPESLGEDAAKNLGTKYKIYSVDADGTLHKVNSSGNGDESVEVLQAGTLSTVLHSSVIKAKIKGPLNGTDVKYLRTLINERNLISIDFSKASFVSGGEVYYTIEDSNGKIKEYTTSDNKISDYSFVKCKNLTKVILPSSVTALGRQAFCNTGLTEIEIPEGVVSLGYDCFGSCSSLQKITIASTVTTMSQGVFWECPKITEVYLKPLVPPKVGAYIFGKKPAVHVPAEAVEAYTENKWAGCTEFIGDL